ncbi:histidine kinase dimerization/phosphoacceptor domain -containing protein [Desulfococcaceae bacterium HSG7]|nr:histidine kinase dimerization/phosphoacceptor domain -containing protein [Desulfococcaceae bacterium HSG7]
MTNKQRQIRLISIMSLVVLVTGGLATYLLYSTAFEQQRERLIETAQSQARLIEAVARFDALYSEKDHQGGSSAATISQIQDAHRHVKPFDEFIDISLVQREGNMIIFLLDHQNHGHLKPKPLPFDSGQFEPARLALSNKSGTLVCSDYRKIMVLAAYEPVAELNLGIVVKIDLVGIRAPFVKTGLIVSGVSIVLIFIGSFLFLRLINPLIDRLLQNEIKIRQSKDELDRIFNLSPDIVGYGTLEGSFTKINSALQAILGYSEDEFLQKSFLDFIHPDDALDTVAELQKTREGVSVHTIDNRYQCKDGTYKWIGWSAVSDISKNEFLAVGRDITVRKRADEQLKASLLEKEVLLKEIHHRVKNNLQVVASLLYLQSKRLPDDETRALFNDSRNRVKSMALVHETLYQSDDLSQLDFAAYIRNLIAHIFRSYRGSTGRITSKVIVDNVSLSIEAAGPCGLIINELVSNALKYAFPAKQGEIRIEMRIDEHERFVLVVSDNGVGFPKDMDIWETGALGLKLVRSLVEQLDGVIELHRNGETAFQIIFTEPQYIRRV